MYALLDKKSTAKSWKGGYAIVKTACQYLFCRISPLIDTDKEVTEQADNRMTGSSVHLNRRIHQVQVTWRQTEPLKWIVRCQFVDFNRWGIINGEL
ncbi:hypothetical protein CDAR_497441 [Caerostris darwini]|uniref:Uncharacterized protein n=1 Tax=Caerostris darwini TaxID=1538125 RepID=A0AAV4S3G5_9ARAC|nr:hypothetical protein CDAR_497441 [Caerostris darwini]